MVPTAITWSLIRTDSAICYSSFTSTVIRNIESSFFPIILGAPYSNIPGTTTKDSISTSKVLSTTVSNTTSESVSPYPSSTLQSTSVQAPISHSGLATTARIGVGLGVPLGFLIAALLALLYRYRGYLQLARAKRHQNKLKSRPEANEERNIETRIENSEPQEIDDGIERHEVSGTNALPQSRELEGSPGPHREEMGD